MVRKATDTITATSLIPITVDPELDVKRSIIPALVNQTLTERLKDDADTLNALLDSTALFYEGAWSNESKTRRAAAIIGELVKGGKVGKAATCKMTQAEYAEITHLNATSITGYVNAYTMTHGKDVPPEVAGLWETVPVTNLARLGNATPAEVADYMRRNGTLRGATQDQCRKAMADIREYRDTHDKDGNPKTVILHKYRVQVWKLSFIGTMTPARQLDKVAEAQDAEKAFQAYCAGKTISGKIKVAGSAWIVGVKDAQKAIDSYYVRVLNFVESPYERFLAMRKNLSVDTVNAVYAEFSKTPETMTDKDLDGYCFLDKRVYKDSPRWSPEQEPEQAPEQVPEQEPEQVPEQVPEQEPEQVPEQEPEQA